MKFPKNQSLVIITALLIVAASACKTKKLVEKPAPVAEVVKKEVVEEKKPEPVVEKVATAIPVITTPNYNFSNVQFDFDSYVIRTSSYPMLDAVAAEMKKVPSVKFVINGYSSAEGTHEHNVALSEQRANAIKMYLVNAGVDAGAFTVKGWGESNPISANDTEEGKALNRRAEIKLNQ